MTRIESRSIDWIPERERHGRLWHQAPLWFLGNFQYFTIPIGFIGPSLGLSIWWTIAAGLLGIIVGTFFMAFHGSQGPKLGLPQMIQSRAQFGYRGVVIVLFAALFTYLAFNVADQVLLSQGLSAAYGWNAGVVAVIGTLGAAVLAIFGHDWVHRVFRVLLVITVPLMAAVTVGILSGHAGGTIPKAQFGFTFKAFLAEFSASAAYNITFAPCVSDYSRYLPSGTKGRSVIASVFIGASTSALWLIAIGAWLAVRLGVTDGLLGIKAAGNRFVGGLGSLTAFSLAVALAATMAMSAYGGSLTLLTAVDAFKKIKTTKKARVVSVIGLAVLWYVVGAMVTTNAVNTVLTALTLMLYLLVPWTATNLVDYFYVRKGHYAITQLFLPRGVYTLWNWRGLTAYAIGFIAEIPFMVLPQLGKLSYIGPLANSLGGVDISWLVGLPAAGVAYLILSRSLDLSTEQEAIRESAAVLQAEFR